MGGSVSISRMGRGRDVLSVRHVVFDFQDRNEEVSAMYSVCRFGSLLVGDALLCCCTRYVLMLFSPRSDFGTVMTMVWRCRMWGLALRLLASHLTTHVTRLRGISGAHGQ